MPRKQRNDIFRSEKCLRKKIFMRSVKEPILIILLALAPFLLTGYRPDWDARLAKECSGNMAKLKLALELLPVASAAVRGSGDSITDYPLIENGLLTTLPVCPAEQFREPSPLHYAVEKASDSSLIVKCCIHGTRETLIYRIEDAYQGQEILEKAIAAKRAKHRNMLMLSTIALGMAPFMLFLTARIMLGYEFFARKAIIMKRLFAIAYSLILAFGLLLFLSVGYPLDIFVKILFVVSMLSYFFGHCQLSSDQKRSESTKQEPDYIAHQ